MIVLGVVIGFILGSRAARDAMALEARKQEERAARRSAREKPPN